ncbi:hypothetical protein [Pseudoduganella violaceinigra]|uniref:hypothetical protein n=1 Tax=Pseudoduganella violaceinigra TaxID=246602 RepID=UPI0004194594|nr:hypothetical protein [Pseudoduganella violaceinigra]
MTGTYRHLPLADVQPGMVLSDELLDMQGQVLLPAGTVLTEKMLERMPGHSVESLAVVDDAAPDPQQTAAERAAQLARIAYLFRRHDDDDVEDGAAQALRALVTSFRAGGEAA